MLRVMTSCRSLRSAPLGALLFSLSGLAGLAAQSSAQTPFSAIYQFTGNVTCPTTNDGVTAQPANATFGTMVRSTVGCVATTNAYANALWNVAALDPSRYIAFTVTANSGYTMSFATTDVLSFSSSRNAGGPTNGEVRYSVDGGPFLTLGTFNPASAASFALPVITAATSLQVRIHAWGASFPSTRMTNDNIQLTGTTRALGADLAVTKTVDDATPNEGGTVVYTVTVANGGPDATSGVAITDLLPVGVTFVAALPSQGSYSSGTGVWTVGSLANAASGTLALTATVNTSTAGSTITNTASVTASALADTNPANNSDTADITVQSADLSVIKTVDDATPNEGATVVYTVTVANGGPDAASSITITDLLPPGVTFVSALPSQGSYSSGSGIWTVGSLANASSATLALTATVDASTAGATITNTASVTGAAQADTNPANNSDFADVTVQSAGPTETQLTSGAFLEERPTWSPDDVDIAFDSDRSGNPDLWVMPSAGGAVTRITTNPLFDRQADWSPDGTKLAYSSRVDAQNPNGDIWLIPPTGGTPTLLASDPATDDRLPAWSPDGLQIAYAKDADLYVVPSSGGTPVQITSGAASDLHPTWSADGTKIAFTSDRSGNNDVWVVPASGGTATQLTTDPADDNTPDWSTDGVRIVFASNRSGQDDLWVMPAAGGPATRVTTSSLFEVQPAWSQQGSRIAFARGGDLWILSLPPCDIAVTKSVNDPVPDPGDTITYTVAVTNNGPQNAGGIEVQDLLPPGATFLGAAPSQGTYASGTGVWTVGSLDVSQSATLAVTATVDIGMGGLTIVDTASLRGLAADVADVVSANNSASAPVVVQADLAISSAANQQLFTGWSPAAIKPLTITDDNAAPSITAANDLRIRIPASFNMQWDTTDAAGVIAGPAAAKVATSVTYEDAGKTVVLDVTTDFTANDRITVTGLAFANFSAPSSPDNLELEVHNDGVVSAVDDKTIEIADGTAVLDSLQPPSAYALGAAWPNPFRKATNIHFDIPSAGIANLSVFDVTGRLVTVLVRGAVDPGRHAVVWDGRDGSGMRVAGGVYLVRLESGPFAATRKVVQLK